MRERYVLLGPMMASKPYFTNPVVDEVVAAALTIVIFSKNMRLHKDVVLDSDDAIFFFSFFFFVRDNHHKNQFSNSTKIDPK
jgi:hypothetical protein